MNTREPLPPLVTAPRPARVRQRLARLAREPFIHFLVIGALLFGAFMLVGDSRDRRADRIDITTADLEQLRSVFSARWLRPPSAEELQGLIEDRIREEVLYREALALGLDQDDAIVRRRLAQKLEFLVADVGAPAEPDATALSDYYTRNLQRYREPARLGFTQIYFSPDKRGARAATDATALLEQLRSRRVSPVQAAGQGDRTLLTADYHDRPVDEIARDFGPVFVAALAQLPTGTWQGPVSSGYGLHLVRIGARTEPRQPPLAAVLEQVKRDYLAEQQRAANERVYERLRSRYQVTVTDVPSANAAAGGGH